MPNTYRPVVLAILDGWGYSKQRTGNAILNAAKPNIEDIEKNYPSLLLQASGLAVGMTWGEPGNSEVGHLTIGSGRVISQYLTRINRDIESGYFFQNKELLNAVNHAKTNSSTIHIIGLFGSGSAHSYFNHILALLKLVKTHDIKNYQLHFITDGKDSGLQETPSLIAKLEEYIPGSVDQIATFIGRDYAMDRSGHWELTQRAYNLWVKGVGEFNNNIYKTLESYYAKGFNDANLPLIIFNREGTIKDGDSLIFFNFREDSMRQIIRVFADEHFKNFERETLKNTRITTFTPYIEAINIHSAYPAPYIANGLAETLSLNGKTQLHITETEKHAHVTYFFNCLRNKKLDAETDLLVHSSIDPLDKPEMMTKDITDKVIEELNRQYYDFILINFANADVLAHFGNLEKTIIGVESIDNAIGRLREAILEKNGILIITADHGNAERVVYKGSGDRQTKHDQNPVPFYLVGNDFKKEKPVSSRENSQGLLSDVAPTILELMGLSIPLEISGESLLKNLLKNN